MSMGMGMRPRWTWHGGGIAAARRHFGEGDRPWIDLSTGINPDGWPHADTLPIDWRALPDEEALHALEHAAARHFGLDPAFVCALPGTETGMRLAGSLLAGPAFYGAPGYRTHGEMIAGARPLAPDAWRQADGATLLLANPNNPDGRLTGRADLLALLDRRGAQGWLLIDEAFADATPDMSLADRIGEGRRLLIFRSFGKFFGLAGVRLGFLLGPAAFLDRMRERLGAWPLSAAALAIGMAAYQDAEWIAMTRERLRGKAARLDALLAHHGLRPIGRCPLFRMVEVEDAMALFGRLAGRQILTRPFADDPRALRFGLPGDETAWHRLDEALAHG